MQRQSAASDSGLSGIGLREQHVDDLISKPKNVWLEWLVDNYMHHDLAVHRKLSQIRERYQVAFHGVGLNIGSTDPLDTNYLQRLGELVDWYEPFIVSDHLSFVTSQGQHHHDLMPVVLNEKSLQHWVRRVHQVQDFLKRPILLENASVYLRYQVSDIPEQEFLKDLSTQTGCGILLDINNVWVNSVNHGFDPWDYIQFLSQAPIGQLHLAGHLKNGGVLIDTHGAAVTSHVWELYKRFLHEFGKLPTLIEWDQNIPPLEIIFAEVHKANDYQREISQVFAVKSMQASKRISEEEKECHWQECQTRLSQAVLNPKGRFAEGQQTQGTLGQERGLEVYRLNLLVGVINQLKRDMPDTVEALSVDNFEFFVREFVYAGYASRESLEFLKISFQEFLQCRPQLYEESWLHEISLAEVRREHLS